MTSQTGRAAPTPAHQLLDTHDRDVFAEMFDAHAAHLFDYCCELTGDRVRAASATQITLIAAHGLIGQLTSAERMRAWLLALARRECLPDEPAGEPDEELADALAVAGETDSDVAEADTGELVRTEIETTGLLSVRRQLRELPAAEREVLDLIYRHDVSPADLPAVLRIPAAAAASRLAAATSRFERAVAAAANRSAGTGEYAGPIESAGAAEPAGPESAGAAEPAGPESAGAAEPAGPESAGAAEPAGTAESADSGTDGELAGGTDGELAGPADGEPVSAAAALSAAAQPAADDPAPPQSAADPGTGLETGRAADGLTALGWLAALPLTRLPASTWRRAARCVLDPRLGYVRDAISAHAGQLGRDGFPVVIVADNGSARSGKRRLLARTLLAGLLLTPIATGAVGYAEFGNGSHAAGHPHSPKSAAPASAPTSAASTVSPASAVRGHHGKRAHKSVVPHPSAGVVVVPAPDPTKSAKPRPSSSPSRFSPPTSPPPASSPPPSSPPPTSSPPTSLPSSSPPPSSTELVSASSVPDISLPVLLLAGEPPRYLSRPPS